jgi:hypothetical protein
MRRYRFAFGVWDGGELNDDTPFRTSTWVSLDHTFFAAFSTACLLAALHLNRRIHLGIHHRRDLSVI